LGLILHQALAMKISFVYLTVLILFCACRPGGKKDPEKDLSIDNQEKKMIDAIRKFPDSLLLKENLAQYYRSNANYDKAIGLISETLQKDSGNARLWDIKAILHFENEDTLNALLSFETAVRLYPDPQYMMSLGSLYAQTKNPKALQVADSLLANKNARAAKEAIFIKGLYYNYTGETKKAIALFDQCLVLDYTYMMAYREKAIALYDQGLYEEAISVLEKATILQNNFDEGYYWMGRCYEKLNRREEAIDSYNAALFYDPEFQEAKDGLLRLGVK